MKSFRPAEVARRRNVQACDFAASREIHSELDPLKLGVSHPYATLIKRGLKIPVPTNNSVGVAKAAVRKKRGI
jgi:hypothetical protein